MTIDPDLLLAPAARLGVDVPALTAVVAVESAGAGLVEGRPIIRLEVHHLWRRCTNAQQQLVDQRFKVEGPKSWEGHRYLDQHGAWVDLHQAGPIGQKLEWEALTTAKRINLPAAIESTSWGLGQILGDAWARLGFTDVQAFVAAQYSTSGQLDTMATYIAVDPVLLTALRAHSWRSFAAVYNGKGKVDDYAGKLQAAYTKAGGV